MNKSNKINMLRHVGLAAWLLVMGQQVNAQGQVGVDEIVDRINAVDHSTTVSRRLEMTLVDKRGKERKRETIIFKKRYDDSEKSVLFFTEPANVRDTGFLTWDYQDRKEEDLQWLYLPALRKSRRISAADRGDYFLGTDFTYEDIKLDGKLERSDYVFEYIGEEIVEGATRLRLKSVPRSEEVGQELGYSEVDIWVDPENWMVTRSEFRDLKGEPLKQLVVEAVARVEGIWTREKLVMKNHKTGHTTYFRFYDVDYSRSLEDRLFTQQALSRGP